MLLFKVTQNFFIFSYVTSDRHGEEQKSTIQHYQRQLVNGPPTLCLIYAQLMKKQRQTK